MSGWVIGMIVGGVLLIVGIIVGAATASPDEEEQETGKRYGQRLDGNRYGQ